jgi:hypothetical protein
MAAVARPNGTSSGEGLFLLLWLPDAESRAAASAAAGELRADAPLLFDHVVEIGLGILLAAIGLLYTLSPQRLNRGKMRGKTLDGRFAPVDTTFRTSFQVGPNVGCTV